MQDEKKQRKKGNWGIRSVYMALAVSLVAVAAAAWATFDSISSTLSGSSPDAAESQIVQPTGDTVSGVMEKTESKSADEEVESAASPADGQAAGAAPAHLASPLSNGIVKSFSGATPVYSQTLRDWRAHTGTDFLAEDGEAVKACAAGTVKSVAEDELWGTVVTVSSGELEIAYCGLSAEVPVKKGEQIETGQTVGTVSLVPSEQADGIHLHLEVRRDGSLLDAESLMQPAE